jgi:hypothetical protein
MTPRQHRLQRLDDLGHHLSTRPEALALLGVGSAGIEFERMDEHSDLDFFVIVEDAAKPAYLRSIDWLEAPCPIAYSFENSVDGRKALYTDGIFVEYAVFTMSELAAGEYSGPRVIWQRSPELTFDPNPPKPSPYDYVDYHVNEALTNLFVGLHRDLRGERLSAARFIQQHAVDRILTVVKLTGAGKYPDVFDVNRRAEQRCPDLPLDAFVRGYDGNFASARAVLTWLDERYDLDPVMKSAVLDLLERGPAA